MYSEGRERTRELRYKSLLHIPRTVSALSFDGVDTANVIVSWLTVWPYSLYNGEDEICFWTYLEVASCLELPPWEEMELYRSHFLRGMVHLKIFMYIRPLSLRSRPPSLLRTKDLEPSYEIWKNSELRKEYIAGLAHAWNLLSPAGNADKVVCFGLGALFDSDNGEDNPDKLCRTDPRLNKYRTFLAFETAMMLNGSFKWENDRPAPIKFHDTDYTQQDRDCMTAFAECVGVEIIFMDKCQALLKVDQYTLVLARGLPQLPIRSLIVDIMNKEEGPAGFFCEDIPSHIKTSKDEVAWWAEHKDHPDPPSRRLHCMTEDWDMEDVYHISSWQATLYMKRENVGKYITAK